MNRLLRNDEFRNEILHICAGSRLMTLHDIEIQLRLIEDNRNADPEGAHSARDELYRDVLRAIAAGHRNSGQIVAMARMALRAESIKLKWEGCA